ncbi:MAG: 4-hydroxy-3-methylbut-2-enyl diphosphate reductase, partial [Candidatus Sedimenticola sp. 6PFRAG1]
SSNSNRLREIAEQQGCTAHLIDGEHDIQKSWLESAKHIGVTAGASAPEVLVEQVIQKLQEWGAEKTDKLRGKEENIVFSLPEGLRSKE